MKGLTVFLALTMALFMYTAGCCAQTKNTHVTPDDYQFADPGLKNVAYPVYPGGARALQDFLKLEFGRLLKENKVSKPISVFCRLDFDSLGNMRKYKVYDANEIHGAKYAAQLKRSLPKMPRWHVPDSSELRENAVILGALFELKVKSKSISLTVSEN